MGKEAKDDEIMFDEDRGCGWTGNDGDSSVVRWVREWRFMWVLSMDRIVLEACFGIIFVKVTGQDQTGGKSIRDVDV